MQIHISKNGQQLGPFDQAELARQIACGAVSYDDLAWIEGMADWQPLRQTAFPAAVALVPPPPVSFSSTKGVGLISGPSMNAPVMYAGFWLRVGAILIDGIVLLVPNVVVSMVGVMMVAAVSNEADGPSSLMPIMANMVVSLMQFGIMWVYFAGMESSKLQATLGKKLLGMRVTGPDGGKISFGRATGRFFGKQLSALILGIGFLMVGFTQKKQGLHDMMANTVITKI